ncbi:hypothetical protein H632_c1718p2 [Helicosporidium sp. ATCC 50920]|nr:hypothetical protein H632_c1718p2 [Helicosporidium sp. ATCC 50920]|eukprot:KDD73934.1 hypothetical protein H632_c1718p2 [Helicosporidium sp. ATCC 50920]
MSSGREDIDVRMLGSGRPFALQIAEPRWLPSPDAVRSLQDRLNAQQQGFVEVRHLSLLDAATVEAIKKSSSEHQKSYAAVCWAARKPTPADFAALAAAGPLVVAQQTPVRVLHRRSNAVRERTVYSMSAHALVLEAGAGARDQTDADGHWFVLRLTTQAGTYIKEFVHGDMGRTSPSLGDLLGCETRIAFLDVTDVHDDGLLDH